eukprot:10156566-Alexandrium_andersonii.AAC.1
MCLGSSLRSEPPSPPRAPPQKPDRKPRPPPWARARLVRLHKLMGRTAGFAACSSTKARP